MTSRFLQNEPAASKEIINSKSQLIDSLVHLVRSYPPSNIPRHDLGGFYYGPTSIAYLFLHLSKSHPNLAIEGRTPREWCKKYLAVQRKVHKTDSSHCGVANEALAYHAVSAAESQDLAHVEKLLGFSPVVIGGGEGSDEWLYGRAGYLYMLRLVRHWVPSSVERTTIQDVMKQVIEVILRNGPNWAWHGKEYLGAVHGAIGIITQVVLTSQERAKEVESLLTSLLALQDQEGNWPSSRGKSGPGELVQFCHGAPGYLISLRAIRPAYQYRADLVVKIDEAISRGEQCVWKYGVLTKEPCLCHGTSGNAFTFDVGSEEFRHFLNLTTRRMIEEQQKQGTLRRSDTPYGLYTGLAGRAWAFAVDELGSGGLIGYSDL